MTNGTLSTFSYWEALDALAAGMSIRISQRLSGLPKATNCSQVRLQGFSGHRRCQTPGVPSALDKSERVIQCGPWNIWMDEG